MEVSNLTTNKFLKDMLLNTYTKIYNTKHTAPITTPTPQPGSITTPPNKINASDTDNIIETATELIESLTKGTQNPPETPSNKIDASDTDKIIETATELIESLTTQQKTETKSNNENNIIADAIDLIESLTTQQKTETKSNNENNIIADAIDLIESLIQKSRNTKSTSSPNIIAIAIELIESLTKKPKASATSKFLKNIIGTLGAVSSLDVYPVSSDINTDKTQIKIKFDKKPIKTITVKSDYKVNVIPSPP